MAEEEEVRRRLSVFFGGDVRMVDAYLQSFGTAINVRNIQSTRERMAVEAETALQSGSRIGSGLEPTYKLSFDCPSCKMWNLEGHELHAKSQIIRFDPFQVPVYQGHGGYRTANFLLMAVTVCPRCLFASTDKKDFIQLTNNRKERKESQLPQIILDEWQNSVANRSALKAECGIGEELFRVPRSFEAAILSYRLADMRAELEARNQSRFAWYKRSNYWVRIAALQRQAGKDDLPSIELAAKYYAETFRQSDWPGPEQEGQGVYVLFMLNLKLGKQKEARDYLAATEASRKDLETNPSGENAKARAIALGKWADRCKQAWEDRDEPRLWELSR